MEPVFFANQFEFRKWLKKNYKTQTEILVGFYKVGSGKTTHWVMRAKQEDTKLKRLEKLIASIEAGLRFQW